MAFRPIYEEADPIEWTLQEHILDDDLKKMVFLCADIFPGKSLSEVKQPRQLYKLIHECKRESLLTELLSCSNLCQLLNELKLQKCADNEYRHVSPYRRLLFEIGGNMGEKDVRNFKIFLPSKNFQTRDIENCTDFFDVIILMERQRVLSKENLDTFENILGKINRKDLATKIGSYSEKQLQKLDNFPLEEDKSERTYSDRFRGVPDHGSPNGGDGRMPLRKGRSLKTLIIGLFLRLAHSLVL